VSDRCVLSVKWTAAGTTGVKAVGGFLRYIHYRDKHPDSRDAPKSESVSGLLKYVAYRDRATSTGRLFGPGGPAGDDERRDLARFVREGLESTRPQLTSVEGKTVDRRRSVYRFVLSPERAEGLDLQQLTRAAVDRLERESQVCGLRWIAAEHRNTAHPHVHIVLAGVREEAPGRYRGFVLTPRRLAAMKDELTLEIARQRGLERAAPTSAQPLASQAPPLPAATQPRAGEKQPLSASDAAARERLPQPRIARVVGWRPRPQRSPVHSSVFFQLQLAALRYRRRLEHEAEEEAHRRDLEWSR